MTTKIEWTRSDDGTAGRTWNPASGCDKVSPGCDNCYALTMAKRLKAMGAPGYQADGDPRTSGPGFAVSLHPDRLDEPLRWRKPARIFVDSMGDLFHADVPDAYIARVFAVMAATPHHTYQVLTKRHGRMRSLLSSGAFRRQVDHVLAEWAVRGAPREKAAAGGSNLYVSTPDGWPLPNVWLGVSAEDQDRWNLRVPALLATPAAVRWVSAEPMLGPIDPCLCRADGSDPDAWDTPETACPVHGSVTLDWVVLGGESGGGARPLDTRWVTAMIGDTADTGTATFVKQLGSVWAREHGRKGKAGEPSEWPEQFRVRQWPEAAS